MLPASCSNFSEKTYDIKKNEMRKTIRKGEKPRSSMPIALKESKSQTLTTSTTTEICHNFKEAHQYCDQLLKFTGKDEFLGFTDWKTKYFQMILKICPTANSHQKKLLLLHCLQDIALDEVKHMVDEDYDTIITHLLPTIWTWSPKLKQWPSSTRSSKDRRRV